MNGISKEPLDVRVSRAIGSRTSIAIYSLLVIASFGSKRFPWDGR